MSTEQEVFHNTSRSLKYSSTPAARVKNEKRETTPKKLTAFDRRCLRALQYAMLNHPPADLSERECCLIALRCEQNLRRDAALKGVVPAGRPNTRTTTSKRRHGANGCAQSVGKGRP